MSYDKSDKIKKIALDIGFDLVGITEPVIPEKDKENFREWLQKGYHAEMDYMQRNTDLRNNPKKLKEKTKSIIVLAKSYYPPKIPDTEYSISKYALGKDYHKYLKKKMKSLYSKLKDVFGEFSARAFVDSAPVLERSLAVKAGIGWIGKNSCLINRKTGSFFFICELFTDLELKSDIPFEKNYCGNCTKCIDACPTYALSKNGLNSSKCISYHTIETKHEIPDQIISKMKDQIFGCDICQDVCPYNKKPLINTEEKLFAGEHLNYLSKRKLENMSDEEFREVFAGTPIMRSGKEKLLNTINSLNK